MHEKFSMAQVAMLHSDMVLAGMDRLQVAEAIKGFLASYGYGISIQTAHDMAARVELRKGGEEVLHRELEASALLM